ncbi:MAG: hypothetical protein QXN36_07325 [Candidatus Bathyarchaeia archaeon]
MLTETKRATTKICRINTSKGLIALILIESFVYRFAKELLHYSSHYDEHIPVFKMEGEIIQKNSIIEERRNSLLQLRKRWVAN